LLSGKAFQYHVARPRPAKKTTSAWPLEVKESDLYPESNDLPSHRFTDLKKEKNRGSERVPWEIVDEHLASTPATGLVLIAGGTGSGKTTALNVLVAKHMSRVLLHDFRKGRRPHVVVVGDPVETTFYGDKMELAESRQKTTGQRTVDFTARVLGVDVRSVHEALRDALRETPAAVVVGELRDRDDFRAALDFAATGHLIFSTSHSTSLEDVFRKLLDVTDATTPSGRAALIQRIRSVIHIRKFERNRIPIVWTTTSMARRSFIAEGLSSLVPGGKPERGLLGRLWMVDQLAVRRLLPSNVVYRLRLDALAADINRT